MRISKRQTGLLLEASRRWLQADDVDRSRGLTSAWTGLGSASGYRPATDAGLMTCATVLNPGHATWWRLTDKGAEIVRGWIANGLKLEHFETDWTGAYSLARQSGVTLTDDGMKAIAKAQGTTP